jgi:hypothetical protein
MVMIYVIEADIKGEKMYKIGYTKTSAKERLKQLQTACPVKLSLVKTLPGNLYDEARVHSYLACIRSHGEWFHDGPLIHEFLKLKDGEPPFKTPNPRTQIMKRIGLYRNY